MMTKKNTNKEKNQQQRQRFIEAAKEIEADESGKSFEDAFKKIVPSRKSPLGKLPRQG